jgi:hypothetical protein
MDDAVLQWVLVNEAVEMPFECAAHFGSPSVIAGKFTLSFRRRWNRNMRSHLWLVLQLYMLQWLETRVIKNDSLNDRHIRRKMALILQHKISSAEDTLFDHYGEQDKQNQWLCGTQ